MTHHLEGGDGLVLGPGLLNPGLYTQLTDHNGGLDCNSDKSMDSGKDTLMDLYGKSHLNHTLDLYSGLEKLKS